MISGSAFQELGAVIDELEANGMTVLDVTAERDSLVTGEHLAVEVTVGLEALTEFGTATNARVVPAESTSDSGLVTTTFTVEIPVGTDGDAEVTATEATPSGRQELTEAASADEATSSTGDDDTTDDQSVTSTSQVAADGDESVPYYKDYDRLARVYEKYDTFAEMTEALGVDVTPATVREHMVNHGIHPGSSDEGSDTDSDTDDSGPDADTGEDERGSVTIEADGYGLPESVSMDSLVHAVRESRTVYEVQRDLDLDRDTVRTILCDLNLLDLVTSRITDAGTTDIDDVVERIHSASTV